MSWNLIKPRALIIEGSKHRMHTKYREKKPFFVEQLFLVYNKIIRQCFFNEEICRQNTLTIM